MGEVFLSYEELRIVPFAVFHHLAESQPGPSPQPLLVLIQGFWNVAEWFIALELCNSSCLLFLFVKHDN